MSFFQLHVAANLAHRGTHSGCDLKCGASAVLPRGLATYAGAASGIIPFGTTAEAWGAATALGQDRAGNARLILDPRKHGLKLSQGCHSSWREPRLKRRKASAPPSQPFPAKLGEEGGMDAQPRPRHRQTATFAGVARHVVGMRLSALRLPFGGANSEMANSEWRGDPVRHSLLAVRRNKARTRSRRESGELRVYDLK